MNVSTYLLWISQISLSSVNLVTLIMAISTISPPTNPSTKGNVDLLIVQSTFVGIAAALTITRVYVRTLVVKRFGLDDASILIALVGASSLKLSLETDKDQSLSLVTCAMTSVSAHHSIQYLEKHYDSKVEAMQEVITALKWSSIAAPIGILAGLFTRLSICLFLLRIFGTKKHWRWGLYSIMVFVTIIVIPTLVSLIGQCTPVQKQWNPTLQGHCWPPKTVIDIGYFNGGK